MSIVEQIFSDIEKYENRYGISIPIGAYMQIKQKWLDRIGFWGDNELDKKKDTAITETIFNLATIVFIILYLLTIYIYVRYL